MPLYEYGCGECGHRLEAQQKLADAPLTTCPTCGKESLSKLISATSFVLKGGGWYKDGYSGSATKRTENQRTDSLEKAIKDDKTKTATASESSGGGGSEGAASSSPPSTPSSGTSAGKAAAGS